MDEAEREEFDSWLQEVRWVSDVLNSIECHEKQCCGSAVI
jgi:hypothetical protein